MDTIAANDQIHNETAQAWDRYISILALRDAEKDVETWKRLNFAQQKAFQDWLHLQERATMRSDFDSYTADQKLG